jgi:hypothetical protein
LRRRRAASITAFTLADSLALADATVGFVQRPEPPLEDPCSRPVNGTHPADAFMRSTDRDHTKGAAGCPAAPLTSFMISTPWGSDYVLVSF